MIGLTTEPADQSCEASLESLERRLIVLYWTPATITLKLRAHSLKCLW